MKWIKLTDYNGTPVWVNVAIAAQIIRYQGYETTNIEFQGGERGFVSVIVKETPEQIFYQTNQQNWG